MLHVSEDGGKTFREDRFEKVHPDMPRARDRSAQPEAAAARHRRRRVPDVRPGDDVGAREHAWRSASSTASPSTTARPYRICGGLQDNLNWVGPSATRTKDGIINADWINIGGGDGFYCVFDPSDPERRLRRVAAGVRAPHGPAERRRQDRCGPSPQEGQPAFRFHWNSPLVAQPAREGRDVPRAATACSSSTEQGETWKAISPDLSTRRASSAS